MVDSLGGSPRATDGKSCSRTLVAALVAASYGQAKFYAV